AGLVYRYKNEPELSKTYFESSRLLLEKMLKENPNDERLHSSLGIVYAGLGENEKAIAKGKKGTELLPLEKEAYKGYYREWDMAIIYTLIGDFNSALRQIDFILSIPGPFSLNQLKLDPLFDPLRNLPGYKAIVAKYN
ncbi:MAG: tetratricopeptide repeat protein, partial [Ignavibacteria bacterium]